MLKVTTNVDGANSTKPLLSWYPKPKKKVIIDGKPMISTGTYRDGNARLIVEAPEMYSLLSRIIGNKSAMEHISDEW